MIEFFLSKIWTVIFGLALVISVVASFSAIDSGTENDMMERGLQEFSLVLSEVSRFDSGSSLDLELRSFLPKGGMMVISSTYIKCVLENRFLIQPLGITLCFEINDMRVSDITVRGWEESILHLRAEDGYLVVHLTKSSTISATVSTNL